MWDANKGGTTINNATFTYPYVDAATFNLKDDMTYVGRPYLWSPDFAWMYGFAAPDNNGNVAMQAVYGGGDYHSIQPGVANNFSADSFPWKVIQVVNGTNGPSGVDGRLYSLSDHLMAKDLDGLDQGGLFTVVLKMRMFYHDILNLN